LCSQKTPKFTQKSNTYAILCRESTVIERLLNKRYAKLYPSTFATYRKDTEDSPSKVWPITGTVTITPVEDHEYHLRHAKTSTLWAVAAGAYDKKQMWGFTVNWSATVGGPDKLPLAFESKDEAEEWHLAFSQAISKAALRPALPRAVSVSGSDASTTNIDFTGSFQSRGSALDEQQVLAAASADQQKSASPSFNNGVDGPTPPPRKIRAWASVMHINGISVYVEEQDEAGEGGAVMVSAVVRAPPVDVFRSLVQVRRSDGLGIFAGARTVEVIDANTQVVAQTWQGSGIVGSMCAPREMVLLRTWRKDEDGTYIVLYQSTNHPSVRRAQGWGWRTPVRVKVQAAGFTIAPLLPQYTIAGESQESLVTLVLKADLGGFLSGASLGGRLATPVTGHAMRSMLEPVVASIVVLRDRVEQNRFVVRPLTVAKDAETQEHDEQVEKQKRKFGKSSTLLFRSTQPLALEQRQAAEEARRPAAESLVLDAGLIGGKQPSPATPAIVAATREEEEAAAQAVASTIAEAVGAAPLTTVPVPASDADAWAIAGSCPKEYWLSPGSCGFKLRGANYLVDHKKVLGAPPMFELVAVDLLELEEPMFHICKHLPSVRHSPAPFLFCVQMMVPSSPPVSLVSTWAAPMPLMDADPADLISQFEKEHGPCPDNVSSFFRSFTEFLSGDGPEADKLRNKRFKLIPNISQGSWIIKQSVGTTPVILGQKLRTKYFRGERYFEVDVDIGASSVAASITNLVCGATKSLAVDLGVLLEGQIPQHLPEQLVGTVRLDKLDLKSACYFDESTGRLVQRD
jgi:Protein ENHANCED DISEASE RESISTANCE 2, C-terminal/START domain